MQQWIYIPYFSINSEAYNIYFRISIYLYIFYFLKFILQNFYSFKYRFSLFLVSFFSHIYQGIPCRSNRESSFGPYHTCSCIKTSLPVWIGIILASSELVVRVKDTTNTFRSLPIFVKVARNRRNAFNCEIWDLNVYFELFSIRHYYGA